MAEDLTSLLERSRARAAERRERIAALTDELLRGPRGLLTDSERSAMAELVHGLVESIAEALRPAIAVRLEQADAMEALRALGEVGTDEIYARLDRAGALSEPELIEAAYHRMLAFRLETLARTRSARPAEDRGARGEDDVVARLLQDASPEIARAVTTFLVDQSKRIGAYRNPLLLPADLPEPLARRTAWAAAAAFRAALAERTEADPAVLDDAAEGAAREALAAGLAEHAASARAIAVAGRLVEAGLAGPDLLAPLLRQGEVALFEALLARLTGIDPTLLRRFLFEPDGEALAACARAAGLSREGLRAILEARRAARRRPRSVVGDDVAAALETYDGISEGVAAELVRRWARARDYQSVLRRFESPAGNGAPRSAQRP